LGQHGVAVGEPVPVQHLGLGGVALGEEQVGRGGFAAQGRGQPRTHAVDVSKNPYELGVGGGSPVRQRRRGLEGAVQHDPAGRGPREAELDEGVEGALHPGPQAGRDAPAGEGGVGVDGRVAGLQQAEGLQRAARVPGGQAVEPVELGGEARGGGRRAEPAGRAGLQRGVDGGRAAR
ncbi:MAG: hypothetical protein ACK559_26220, partial [bacterium]